MICVKIRSDPSGHYIMQVLLLSPSHSELRVQCLVLQLTGLCGNMPRPVLARARVDWIPWKPTPSILLLGWIFRRSLFGFPASLLLPRKLFNFLLGSTAPNNIPHKKVRLKPHILRRMEEGGCPQSVKEWSTGCWTTNVISRSPSRARLPTFLEEGSPTTRYRVGEDPLHEPCFQTESPSFGGRGRLGGVRGGGGWLHSC